MTFRRVICWLKGHLWWDTQTLQLPVLRLGKWGLFCCERCGLASFRYILWDQYPEGNSSEKKA